MSDNTETPSPRWPGIDIRVNYDHSTAEKKTQGREIVKDAMNRLMEDMASVGLKPVINW